MNRHDCLACRAEIVVARTAGPARVLCPACGAWLHQHGDELRLLGVAEQKLPKALALEAWVIDDWERRDMTVECPKCHADIEVRPWGPEDRRGQCLCGVQLRFHAEATVLDRADTDELKPLLVTASVGGDDKVP